MEITIIMGVVAYLEQWTGLGVYKARTVFALSQECNVKAICLTDSTSNWHAIVREVQSTGVPIMLTVDGVICGILLPPQEASHVAMHYDVRQQRRAQAKSSKPFEELPNYLDLLRADPSLVPAVDGQALEFLTMMNSSFVDPQQLYQFRHPQTLQIYVYRAEELKQAIGRAFARVEFIPARPKDYVEGKQ